MAAPVLNLDTILSPTPKPVDLTLQSYTPPPLVAININTTPITDGQNVGYLSSLVKRVDNDAKKLILDGQAKISIPNGSGATEAAFDYQYDSAGGKLGAGTAFLQS